MKSKIIELARLEIAIQKIDPNTGERGDFLMFGGRSISPVFVNMYQLLVWMNFNDFEVVNFVGNTHPPYAVDKTGVFSLAA